MAEEEVVLEIGVIDISADPHRPGIYPNLLKKIALTPVKLWGDNFVGFTTPEQDGGLWAGRIFVWTELDPTAPAVNTKRLEELSLADAHVSVPSDIGINGRIFYYAFREKDHKLFFETKNEFGKHLAPDRLVRPLEQLLAKATARSEVQVRVMVWPEDDALKNILAIPKLATLEIYLRKPNPDDNDVEAEDILRELEEQGAGKKDIKLTAKSRKKGLKPNQRTVVEAHVAAETGYVRGAGKDRAGNLIQLSTEEYPKKIPVALSGFATVLGAVKRVARETVLRVRGRRVEPH